MEADLTEAAYREPDASLVTTTQVTYALHALGLAIGAFGGNFVMFGWPSVIAVIINYVRRNDARGTWLESHFTWQIRTFWFAFAWSCTLFILGAVLLITLAGIETWVAGAVTLGVWAIYRIGSGWMRLRDRRPI